MGMDGNSKTRQRGPLYRVIAAQSRTLRHKQTVQGHSEGLGIPTCSSGHADELEESRAMSPDILRTFDVDDTRRAGSHHIVVGRDAIEDTDRDARRPCFAGVVQLRGVDTLEDHATSVGRRGDGTTRAAGSMRN